MASGGRGAKVSRGGGGGECGDEVAAGGKEASCVLHGKNEQNKKKRELLLGPWEWVVRRCI